jgi:hypothetical protein
VDAESLSQHRADFIGNVVENLSSRETMVMEKERNPTGWSMPWL